MAARPNRNDMLVARALRAYAERLMSEESVPVEEGRQLDRALRSCKGISDIDRVWVRWGYVGGQRGWCTSSELTYDGKTGYWYPDEIYDDTDDTSE